MNYPICFLPVFNTSRPWSSPHFTDSLFKGVKNCGQDFCPVVGWNKILDFDSCKKDQGLAYKPEDLINRKY